MTLRELEASSIRRFVQSAADDGYLSGRVLDFGCGKKDYESVITNAGGKYHGYDRKRFPGNVSGKNYGSDNWCGRDWDAILCVQVLQYIPFGQVEDLIADFASTLLERGGVLVMTYPTHWPEVEPEDLHRFTKAGVERLLTEAGFTIVRHERRAELVNRDGMFALGYGAVARA